jgi:hypothetical protein
MENRELTRQLQKLRSLIRKIAETSVQDFELQAHWGRYLCVLVAGFLENAIAEIYTDFVNSAASEPVASFASLILGRIQNPNSQRFLETARSFRQSWAEDLENFLMEQGRKDAIDSIIANRHAIAHGRDSGITVVRVVEFEIGAWRLLSLSRPSVKAELENRVLGVVANIGAHQPH